jgi:hypothetical protein
LYQFNLEVYNFIPVIVLVTQCFLFPDRRAASRIEHCHRENERIKTMIEKPVFFTRRDFRQRIYDG